MSAAQPKIVILYDFDPKGDLLAETMREEIAGVSGLEVVNLGERCRYPTNLINKWRRALHNLTYAVRVQSRIGPRDHILCWQQNLGIALCLYWRLFGGGRDRKVYITGTTTTPVRRRFPIRNMLNFAFGSRNLTAYFANNKFDFSVLPKIYSNLRRDGKVRFAFFSAGVDLKGNTAPDTGTSQEVYFVSSGRSNRKYDFFVDFFQRNPQYRYKIICDNLALQTEAANIEVYRNVYGAENYAMIRGARALLLDLQHKDASSGNTVFVQTMELGVPIIITRCKALEDYMIDGGNCIVIEDGDHDQLKAALEAVKDDAFRARMSEFQKRDHAARFSTREIARTFAQTMIEQR
jgi:glycosyltransferase involved in cell wall biosynthesis